MCILSLVLCCDCICLITLYRDDLLCSRGQAYLSTLFLKDIDGWRTIDWELGSLGSVHAPCHGALSFCGDVRQIKGWLAVIMPRWVVNVLFLLCVGVRGTPVDVVAPVGPSYLVGGSTGRSEWLSLVSRWAWRWSNLHTRIDHDLPRCIRNRV